MVSLRLADCGNCFRRFVVNCRATIIYRDNISAIYVSTNPVQHQLTKYVEIDLHFVRDRVALGEPRVLHVPTTSQR